MISDVLYDAASKITQYRADFPDYDTNPLTARLLDLTVHQLTALGDIIGAPPPPDHRTHRGECAHCHEIAVINLGSLSCEPCQGRIRASLEMLTEYTASAEEELDAKLAADHAERLEQNTSWIITHLRRLDKPDRDHILAAIDKQLLEAR